MKTTVVLPFCPTPVFTMLNNYSFTTGIVQGNHYNSFEPWAYGRYINCLFNPGFGLHIGQTIDVWKNHNDYIQITNRKYGIIPPKKKVSHMKRLLAEGYYIMIVLDEQYIPGMAAFQRWHFLHDSLLIGYNDEKQVFMLYGRFDDENMHISEVPYSNIEKAASRGSWSFILKYVSKSNEHLDISLIRTELSHYLYSSPSSKKKKGTKYGITAVKSLGKCLISQYQQFGYIDYRYTRGLLEQKNLMFNMCQYLVNNGYPLTEDLLQYSKSVTESASIIHMLALKAKVKSDRDYNLSALMKKHFFIIVDSERRYLPELLKCLHS